VDDRIDLVCFVMLMSVVCSQVNAAWLCQTVISGCSHFRVAFYNQIDFLLHMTNLCKTKIYTNPIIDILHKTFLGASVLLRC